MRLFDNKLSRINFLILIGILTYLFANMSNEDAYVDAILMLNLNRRLIGWGTILHGAVAEELAMPTQQDAAGLSANVTARYVVEGRDTS